MVLTNCFNPWENTEGQAAAGEQEEQPCLLALLCNNPCSQLPIQPKNSLPQEACWNFLMASSPLKAPPIFNTTELEMKLPQGSKWKQTTPKPQPWLLACLYSQTFISPVSTSIFPPGLNFSAMSSHLLILSTTRPKWLLMNWVFSGRKSRYAALSSQNSADSSG